MISAAAVYAVVCLLGTTSGTWVYALPVIFAAITQTAENIRQLSEQTKDAPNRITSIIADYKGNFAVYGHDIRQYHTFIRYQRRGCGFLRGGTPNI